MHQPAVRVHQHTVHTSRHLGHNLYLMSHRCQSIHHRAWHILFNEQFLALCPDTRRFYRLLERHTVDDHVDNRLEHGGKYPASTRSPQGHERLAILEDYHGRLIAELALAGGDGVGLARMRIEQVHRIVEQHAGPRCGDLGTEGLMDGLSHGDHVAFAIHGRQVGRIQGLEDGGARLASGVLTCPFHIYIAAAQRSVCLVRQPVEGDIHHVGIAHESIPVGEHYLQHLGQQVEIWNRTEAQGLKVELLQDVEGLDDVGPAAARRPWCYDFVAMKRAPDRWPILHLVPSEVLHGDEAATALHVLDDCPAQITIVEISRPLFGDCLQGMGVFGPQDRLSRRERSAVGQEHLGCIGKASDVFLHLCDEFHQMRTRRETTSGISNGRLHDISQAQPSEAFLHIAPRLQCPWHGHRQMTNTVLTVFRLHVIGPGIGNRLVHIGTRGHWGDGVVVQGCDLAGRSLAKVHETGAEEPHAHGLYNGQSESRGDGGVDSVAAGGQHLYPRG